jgi:hypothetical protein
MGNVAIWTQEGLVAPPDEYQAHAEGRRTAKAKLALDGAKRELYLRLSLHYGEIVGPTEWQRAALHRGPRVPWCGKGRQSSRLPLEANRRATQR